LNFGIPVLSAQRGDRKRKTREKFNVPKETIGKEDNDSRKWRGRVPQERRELIFLHGGFDGLSLI